MAIQHGVPGERARVKGTVLSLWPLFLVFTCLGAFASAIALGRQTPLFASLFFASLIAMAVMWRRGVQRVESFFVGARGEERVAGMLAALPQNCHVFNDFVAAGRQVDHVVVCPGGVFSVETKYWRGRVTLESGCVLVDGMLADRAPLRQAMREAASVQAELEKTGWQGSVTPVLCFASDTFAAGSADAGSVRLINAQALCEWLRAQPETLSPAELERLVQLLSTI